MIKTNYTTVSKDDKARGILCTCARHYSTHPKTAQDFKSRLNTLRGGGGGGQTPGSDVLAQAEGSSDPLVQSLLAHVRKQDAVMLDMTCELETIAADNEMLKQEVARYAGVSIFIMRAHV